MPELAKKTSSFIAKDQMDWRSMRSIVPVGNFGSFQIDNEYIIRSNGTKILILQSGVDIESSIMKQRSMVPCFFNSP
jgi:hypothetical protein